MSKIRENLTPFVLGILASVVVFFIKSHLTKDRILIENVKITPLTNDFLIPKEWNLIFDSDYFKYRNNEISVNYARRIFLEEN